MVTAADFNPASIGVPEVASAAGLGALDGDAFLKLMVAQLKYQNPFEPLDQSQMLQQTAALSMVEVLQRLAGSQSVLMGVQQATMATGLIGKEVTAINGAGEKVTDIVRNVSFTADGPLLKIGEEEIPIGNVVKVKDVDPDGTGS